jgi:prepilin-type N-terminal cleavage/methylation domain-containing protein
MSANRTDRRRSNNSTPCLRRRRRGLSLIEIMIALAIAATLLTAAAAAFNASSDVVRTNDEFFRATQAARVSLHQILTNVRRASSVEDNRDPVTRIPDTTKLQLTTARNDDGSGQDLLTYKYLPANQKLMLLTDEDLTDPDYTLASNVGTLAFDVEMGKDYNNADVVVRVDVSITVKVGRNSVTLSGSAAPRRNIIY